MTAAIPRPTPTPDPNLDTNRHPHPLLARRGTRTCTQSCHLENRRVKESKTCFDCFHLSLLQVWFTWLLSSLISLESSQIRINCGRNALQSIRKHQERCGFEPSSCAAWMHWIFIIQNCHFGKFWSFLLSWPVQCSQSCRKRLMKVLTQHVISFRLFFDHAACTVLRQVCSSSLMSDTDNMAIVFKDHPHQLLSAYTSTTPMARLSPNCQGWVGCLLPKSLTSRSDCQATFEPRIL